MPVDAAYWKSVTFGIGSYSATVTSFLLACRPWLNLFTYPHGSALRPMGEAGTSMLWAATGSLVAVILAICCIVTGRRNALPWVLGIACLLLGLLPIPSSIAFSYWVVDMHAIELKP